MKKIFMILFIMLLCCAGCMNTYDRMINAGYSSSYSSGFSDGEQSGKAAGGSIYAHFIKNVTLSQTNVEYNQGWEDGFRYGKGNQVMINNMASRY